MKAESEEILLGDETTHTQQLAEMKANIPPHFANIRAQEGIEARMGSADRHTILASYAELLTAFQTQRKIIALHEAERLTTKSSKKKKKIEVTTLVHTPARDGAQRLRVESMCVNQALLCHQK